MTGSRSLDDDNGVATADVADFCEEDEMDATAAGAVRMRDNGMVEEAVAATRLAFCIVRDRGERELGCVPRSALGAMALERDIILPAELMPSVGRGKPRWTSREIQEVSVEGKANTATTGQL